MHLKFNLRLMGIILLITSVIGFFVFKKGGRQVCKPDNRELRESLKGKIVFQHNGNGNNEIYTVNASGGEARRLTFTQSENVYPSWSPDGRDIIFYSNRDGSNEIYIMDRKGRNQKRLTNHSANDVNPSWHPNGKQIIFVSDRDGTMNFYLMNKSGSNVIKVTDFKEGVHDMPRVSPDGKNILFTSNMSAGWQVFVFNIGTKEIKRITSVLSGHCEADWSHDGKKILYVTRFCDRDSVICMSDNDGRNERKVVSYGDLNYNPMFSPDDKRIIFVSDKDGNWEICCIDVNGENLLRLTRTYFQEQWPDWKNSN